MTALILRNAAEAFIAEARRLLGAGEVDWGSICEVLDVGLAHLDERRGY